MKWINSGPGFPLRAATLRVIRLVGEEAVIQSFQCRDPSQGVKGQDFLLKKKNKIGCVIRMGVCMILALVCARLIKVIGLYL